MGERKIIAVVGMAGSGKSETANFLKEKGYQFLRFGQLTLDEIKKRGLEINEENEGPIREAFRKEHGMAAFAILNKPKIDEFLSKGDVVIDGLYSWSEYKFLKEAYGDKLKVLAVNTPREIRYSRLEQRTQIDEKMRNRPMTREQAEERDYAEIENIEKAGPIAMADLVVDNFGTKEDLRAQLRGIFDDSRRPKWDEYFLKMAALIAERATCHRHHVGAVIVRGKKVLTTGYNGAGKGLPDCLELGCKKNKEGIASGISSERCRGIHAEQNAIIQAANSGENIDGATLYCTHTPCMMCAKELHNAGIKEVISYQEFSGDQGAKEYLANAGVIMKTLPRPSSRIYFRD